MAADVALIAIETAAMDEPMFVPVAARTAEAIGPQASLLQCSLRLLYGAVEPLELRQRATFWNWIPLSAMIGLIYVYRFMPTDLPVRSELGNQDLHPFLRYYYTCSWRLRSCRVYLY
jgi:hypothetical protein